MDAYDLYASDYPYYAVWYNKNDKFFQSISDDPEKERQRLFDTLQMCQLQGDNAMYYIKIYPALEQNYKRTGEICSIPIRCNQYDTNYAINGPDSRPVYNGGNNSQGNAAIEKLTDLLTEKFDAMNSRIDQLESREPESTDWKAEIAGYLRDPAIGPVIGPVANKVIEGLFSVIGPVLQRIIPGAVSQPFAMSAPGPVIAGVPAHLPETNETMTDDEYNNRLDGVLDRLEKHCDLLSDLEKLADVAEKDPQTFQFLLTSLRAQK